MHIKVYSKTDIDVRFRGHGLNDTFLVVDSALNILAVDTMIKYRLMSVVPTERTLVIAGQHNLHGAESGSCSALLCRLLVPSCIF